MSNSKKTNIFIAVIFFCLGFLTNHLLVKFVHNPTVVTGAATDRFPVDPDDFDQSKMLDTIQRMQKETEQGFGDIERELNQAGNVGIGAIGKREDDKFFYYEIPLKNQDGSQNKMNVEIKDGMVRITEDTKHEGSNSAMQSSSERIFPLDTSRYDANKAEVLNQKDKIIIKIPKK